MCTENENSNGVASYFRVDIVPRAMPGVDMLPNAIGGDTAGTYGGERGQVEGKNALAELNHAGV